MRLSFATTTSLRELACLVVRCVYHWMFAPREPLCDPARKRDSLFPIPTDEEPLFKLYQDAYELFWSPLNSGVDFDHEQKSWKVLHPSEREFLMGLLAFFVVSDGVIADNITENFVREFTSRSVLFFFAFQVRLRSPFLAAFVHASLS